MAYTDIATVRRKSGISSTSDVSDADITASIAEADAEIDLEAGRKFGNATAIVEKLGPFPKDLYSNRTRRFTLSFYPIQTVSYIKLLNRDGTVSKTLAATEYWIKNSSGIVEMKDDVLQSYPEALEASYTYGFTSVPTYINELSALLAGIRIWVQFMGGQYNRLNSYSIPEQSVDKGDFFERGQAIIEKLEERAEVLWQRVGKRKHSTLQTSNWSTPTGVVGSGTNSY